MNAFELTKMETKGKGLFKIRQVFAVEVESKVPKEKLREMLMDPAKGFLTL